MQPTQLRRMAEKLGATIAFVPSPPTQVFRSAPPNLVGSLHVASLSLSDENEEHWVHGWQFSLMDRHGAMQAQLFFDADEAAAVRRLLKRWSDGATTLAFEYHSREGVTFKRFSDSQRITFVTPGLGQMNGVQAPQIVEDVFKFMEKSAEGWPRSGSPQKC